MKGSWMQYFNRNKAKEVGTCIPVTPLVCCGLTMSRYTEINQCGLKKYGFSSLLFLLLSTRF